MKTIRIITVTFIVSALIGVGSVSVSAKEKFTMKIANAWRSDVATPTATLNYVKPRIEQLTNGRVKVELHLGTLGGERDMYEMVRMGTIQAATLTTGPLGAFIPLAEIFNVPFLFEGHNHLHAVLQGPLGDHIKELGIKEGMRFLGFWTVGGRQIYGNGKPVPVHPKDLKNKKVRVMESPFYVETYRHYGALPTPMSYTEVYSGLQQGVIDACQSGLAMILASWNEVCEWCVITDEQITVVSFLVSERWWSKLPDDIKIAIKQAVIEGTTINHVLDALGEENLKKRWAKGGTKVVEGDRKAYQLKARELYPRFAKLLGSDKWLKWIQEVGKAFPINEYETIKKYGGDYKF